MRCLEIMKKRVERFVTTDSAMDIARRMRDRNIGFAPVCGKDGRPIGTVTDRDIAIRVCADDRRASKTRAADVMSHEAVMVHDVDDVGKAEELMAAHHKSRIMVVDDHERLVGVISLSDIALLESDERFASTSRRIVEREAHA